MPNHITNVLDVTGPEKDVEEFKNKIFRYEDEKDYNGVSQKVAVFDFEVTVPMPKELEGTTSPPSNEEKESQAEWAKKHGAGNWYDWHCRFWGTKWNAYSVEKPEAIEGGVRFRFDTAWSPPQQWLIITAKLFPSLELKDSWIDEGGGAGINPARG